jgi:uncharacterized protein YbaR (Trm112 family)
MKSTTPSPATRRDWTAAPVVSVVRPACPFCGHVVDKVTRRKRGSKETKTKFVPGYENARSEDGGDGSQTKYVICTSCRETYKICVEIPTVGNPDFPLEYDATP